MDEHQENDEERRSRLCRKYKAWFEYHFRPMLSMKMSLEKLQGMIRVLLQSPGAEELEYDNGVVNGHLQMTEKAVIDLLQAWHLVTKFERGEKIENIFQQLSGFFTSVEEACLEFTMSDLYDDIIERLAIIGRRVERTRKKNALIHQHTLYFNFFDENLQQWRDFVATEQQRLFKREGYFDVMKCQAAELALKVTEQQIKKIQPDVRKY